MDLIHGNFYETTKDIHIEKWGLKVPADTLLQYFETPTKNFLLIGGNISGAKFTGLFVNCITLDGGLQEVVYVPVPRT